MDKLAVLTHIAQVRPVSPVALDVADWPSGLLVARLTGQEIDDWRSKLSDDAQSINRTNAMWIAVCLLNPEGKRIFDPNSETDITELMTKMPFDVMNNAALKIMRVNGMLDAAREDAVKN